MIIIMAEDPKVSSSHFAHKKVTQASADEHSSPIYGGGRSYCNFFPSRDHILIQYAYLCVAHTYLVSFLNFIKSICCPWAFT